jgi:leader peptidase (prepilin peptidase)/N-methyltransferase
LHIAWYDNIPIVSWLVLRARCRHCHSRISARYVVVEAITGLLALGLYIAYFQKGLRKGMPDPMAGGWLVYGCHFILASGLLAASAVDLELFIIPLEICWVITAAGLAASAIWPLVVANHMAGQALMPVASDRMAAIALGGALGLGFSQAALSKGWIARSYQQADLPDGHQPDHRREMIRELAFLGPVGVGALVAWGLAGLSPIAGLWQRLLLYKPVAGLLGSILGYLVGGGLVWATRIGGTLVFGREAMGLGDVHLMGAVGAVLGPTQVVLAFFLAPFFGLVWAAAQMLYRKIHEIPYGPFLSMAAVVVMIFYDSLVDHLGLALGGPWAK